MGSCAAPSAKGDDKFITTDYLQQCRKFRVHAIRLLASIIKSGSYSVAYIVKKITGKLIKFFTILTIFVFVVEYIAGDIGYKSIYNAALLLMLLTVINILAGVYLNKLLRTKQ